MSDPSTVAVASSAGKATGLPVRLQCKFYLQHKRRHCGMTRKAGLDYCSEHLNTLRQQDPNLAAVKGRRIACPIDPRHSVWEKDVTRHLRRCNTAKKNRPPVDCPWVKLDYNWKPLPASETHEPHHAADDASILRSIPILKRCYAQNFAASPISLEVKRNATVESHRFPQLLGSKKHALQQSSLIQYLLDNKMAPQSDSDDITYIEFGCGRAEFSRYLNRSVFDYRGIAATANGAHRVPRQPRFLLVDRASNRMKFDSKFREDLDELYGDSVPADQRTYATLDRKKIDIKDLYIDQLLQDSDPRCVAISKHLCGVATDLTIHCCLNSDVLHTQKKKLHGMVIAMCCRHVCDAHQYVNRPFIESLIEGSEMSYVEFFNSLKKIASWAVCGRREGINDRDINHHFTNLPVIEREELGQRARRIIDEGRAEFLRSNGYKVSLVKYIESSVSLENVAMVVTRI
ncbi:LADA_0H10616g1_1 [Lachancea dasiensis]|uniref:tRNA:m(4)X modification enzyme TRM13 n=1 Tax=Lachancea dasiensis TaxID=1072105 RepID=A0A1G4K364_9SACH|nr:LADA_0H10616g1_1 [Lachancea dasiensis]